MKRKNHFLSAFILFLHHLGCLEEFMANVVKFSRYSNPFGHLAVLFDSDPSEYLSRAFLWQRTPEGYFFWDQVNNAWAEYRSTYRIS